MRKIIAACVLGLGFLSLQAQAAENPIKARQHVFEQYKKQMGAMGKMLKQPSGYNKDEFAKHAAELETLSTQAWQYFPKGSDKGKTEALPEIWTKTQEWNKDIDTHKAEVAKLNKVAATGDLAAVKVQFGVVQKTCKACHDTFRKPD